MTETFTPPVASVTAQSIHLWEIGEAGRDLAVRAVERLAVMSRAGHRLVGDPSEADLIVVTQPHVMVDPLTLRAFRASDAWRRWPERCVVVDVRDRPWCALPGVYASMPTSRFQRRWQRPWVYPWLETNRFTRVRTTRPDLLFSFVGGRTHPVREALWGLSDPRGLVRDSAGFDPLVTGADDPRRDDYVEVLARSKFVLCPRGQGTASFRFQETLAAGRVPVVISDDWVPPAGPDWDSAVVRWPEANVADLPSHLARIEHRWPDMAAAAAAIHDDWFDEPVMFDRTVEQLAMVAPTDGFPRRGVRDRWWARLVVSHAKGQLLGRLRR